MATPKLDFLQQCLAVAQLAARRAGQIQLTHLENVQNVDFKGVRELVSDIDRACEDAIVDTIRTAFPDHDIYAEEKHRTDSGAEYRWIIDPLDGTTNYVHQLPAFCVAIALEHVNSEQPNDLVVAVVFAPKLDEMFHAVKAQGCYLNNTPIHTSSRKSLIESVVATGFAYVRHQSPNNNLDNWQNFALKCRGIRRMGSAAIDLAFVAAGRLDGYWEFHLEPYDMAAGALLVKEAGGKVTDTKNGEDWLFGKQIVATNGHIHELIRSELTELKPDGFLPL